MDCNSSDFTSFDEEVSSAAEEVNPTNVATTLTRAVEHESTASVELSLEQLRQRARMYVEEYIRSMPAHQKMAYMEAVALAPNIVATETDSLQFVRFCNYDVWAAARRLTLYWDIRKEIFGSDRAFLPLILSGDGALSNEDVLQLKAGFPATLPKSRSGLQVAYLDRRQFIKASTPEMRLRCMFYLAHVASKDDLAQAEGVLLLILLVVPRLMGFELGYVRRALWVAKTVLPIKFRIHVLNRLPKSPDRRFAAQEVISAYVSELLHLGFGPDDTDVFIERENGQMLDYLLDLGLTRQGIPAELGGSWTFDTFAKYCREQAFDDRQKFFNPKSSAAISSAAAAGEKNDDEEEARLKHSRTSNAIHSRRKRDRRRQERDDIKDEFKRLKSEQSLLKVENSRLTELLQQARSLTGDNQSSVARQRASDTAVLSDDDRKPAAKKKGPPTPQPPS
ncbi:hypothetical protein ACA910_013062 [Epithemia clementina (nom. ined.)]